MKSTLRLLILGLVLLLPLSAARAQVAVSTIPDFALNAEDTLNVNVVAVDPNGGSITLTATLPAFATLNDVMGTPAWKDRPTWFAVAQHDQVIPPDAERLFAQRMGATTVEVDSSHVVMISHPDEVVALIRSAVDTL